ncbi:20S proteasome, regulatory subunit beta type PSMB1/PRE7 [Trachipleistophora hominis]|uniref:20S proteasome, regulatory subunit beta type PSMB1/PRE7 n=1 Tax=Trachipleistophora hominis TaxID=72359 RepID=L7JSU7_TRAHO|nr:20S proteasome, regulatory subunit beta type PSMB1/PRE7 [Trachipleistophora hominis]
MSFFREMLVTEDNPFKIQEVANKGPKKHLDVDDLYANNSGTVLAFKQQDYVIIAADTRHSSEMGINSRKMTKIFEFDGFIFSGTGFYADLNEVYFRLRYEVERYENEVEKRIGISALAHKLLNILYSRRGGLIYYVFSVLVGKDETGEPVLYSFDPIGSYEQVMCKCYGSASPMIQPLLDSTIMKYNQENASYQSLCMEESVELTKKAFFAAAERDVNTGDYLQIVVYKRDGVNEELVDLRKD